MMTVCIWSRLPGLLIGQQGSKDFVSRMGLVDINQLKDLSLFENSRSKILKNMIT
jgi:hypothetical protein